MPAVALEAAEGTVPGWGYHDQYAAPHGADAPYEPLATAFAVPFEASGAGGVETTSNLLFFSTRPSFLGTRVAQRFTCPELAGYPYLGFEAIDDRGYVLYTWDMDELPIAGWWYWGCPITCPAPPAETNVLPFATQRVPITADNFDLPDAGGGWMLLALPAAYEEYAPASEPRSAGTTRFEPIANRTGAMGWAGVQVVITVPGASTALSALVEATVLGNRHCSAGDVLPPARYNAGAGTARLPGEE